MNKLLRILFLPLLFLIAYGGAILLVEREAASLDKGPGPVAFSVRNSAIYDGFKTTYISSGDPAPSRGIRPGFVAYQIWNWNHTWYSTKAYSRVVNKGWDVVVRGEAPR